MKLSNCEFAKDRIEILAYIIGRRGLEADPRKTLRVANALLHKVEKSSKHSSCSACLIEYFFFGSLMLQHLCIRC